MFGKILLSLLRIPSFSFLYWQIYRHRVKRVLKRLPSGISIETYNRCNFSCNICPLSKASRKEYIMPMDLYRKILDEAHEMGIRKVNLSLYGEPLLDHLLFQRIELAKKKGFEVSFYTNGSLMDGSKRWAILQSGLDRIFFSLDAFTAETYSKVRPGGDFLEVTDNICKLAELKESRKVETLEIVVTFVLQNANRHEAKEFREFWKQHADRVEFNEADNRNENLSIIGKKFRKSKSVFPCIRLFSSIQVLSNGKVALCCMDYDGKYAIGDLNKETLKDVRESQLFLEFENLHLSRRGNIPDICMNCRELYKYAPYIWWKN